MRILMLSWEFPPKNVGGLSNHVYNISKSLSKCGHEVHVITCEESTAPVEESLEGIFIHRVAPYKIETEDFTKWVMHLNFAIVEEAIRIIGKTGKFDIIHAHDWLSAYAAKVLKWSFNIPMVSTIHATEYGRNNGIKTDMQRYISSVEWMLTYESWKVIVCSNYMRQQVSDLFKIPWEKIWVIPNGVNAECFETKFDAQSFRREYAEDEEKIVLYVGRHVFEKGIHLLIEAAPEILKEYGNAKFVIAGQGPMTEELKERVRNLGIGNKVLFAGYIDEESKNNLYKVSNVAVFPSLYEPFGIVALEAMAGGCPTVVSDTGGLSEIINHGVNGMKFISGLAQSLKDNILEVLNNEVLAETLKKNAMNTVKEKYAWEQIATLTNEMYDYVGKEAKGTEWEVKTKVKKKRVKAGQTEQVSSEAVVDKEEVKKPKRKYTRRKKTE